MEIAWLASVTATMTPVSCAGRKPFGTTTYSSTVPTSVPAAISSTSGWRRSAHPACGGSLAAVRRKPASNSRDRRPARWSRPQQPAAHHRRQRQRHHGGHHDGHGQGDGELVEQPADHARHEQQRDEHGDQRDGQRDDGEADLPGAPERGLQRRHAVLDVAHHVLDHDDRVVDHEPGRDRQRHEREVVQRVAEQRHDAERADQAERQRHGRG